MARNNLSISLTGRLHARLSIWLPAILLVVLGAVYLPMVGSLVRASSITPNPVVAAATTKSAAPAPGASASKAPVVTPTPAAVVAPAPVQNCIPIAFGTPAQLGLVTAATGLSVQHDNPSYYHIYGNSAADLRSQIRRCAPGANGNAGAEFTGETSYALTWQYDSTSDGVNCTVSNVKVGLHIATALPYWQPTAAAGATFTAAWQRFTANLATHEQGHASLDTSYAAKLLNDLNGLGTISCANLAGTISATAAADVAALNTANDTYDVQTNHGATQGAILP